MLIVLKLLALIYIWIIFPILIGKLWSLFKREEHKEAVTSWLLGEVTVWALFFVLAKQGIEAEWKLSELCRTWMVTVLLLSVGSLIYLVRTKGIRYKKLSFNMKKMVGDCVVVAALVIIAFLTVGDREEHMVEEVLTMYTTDSLYAYSPMNGKIKSELLSIEAEALEQQAEAPLSAYYSVYVSLSNIYPAKFVRIILPVFLMPFYFFVYKAWSNYLFPDSSKKRKVFQTVVWMLYGTALVAERSVEFDVFANCWNGETLFFLGVLPLSVLLLLGENGKARSLDEFKKTYLIAEYLVCAGAGQLMCTKGFFFVTFVWGSALIAAYIKRWKDGNSITIVEE